MIAAIVLAWAPLTAAFESMPAMALAGAPELDAAQTQLLTSVVANAAASDPRLDVLSQEDLRRAIELEGEKRAVGCDRASDACMAEIAQALGASLVVHGEVGAIGDELVLSLNLYESTSARSGGRELVRAPDARRMMDGADASTRALLARYLETHPPAPAADGGRVRVLVLDVKLRSANASAPSTNVDGSGPDASGVYQEPPWFLVGAGAAGLVGGASIVVGALLDNAALDSRVTANKAETDQLAVRRLNEQSFVLGVSAIALYIAGGVLVAGAGALAAAQFLVAE